MCKWIWNRINYNSHQPIVGGAQTIEEAETVLLHRHLAQLVLQAHGMDIDALMTQKNGLYIQINKKSQHKI